MRRLALFALLVLVAAPLQAQESGSTVPVPYVLCRQPQQAGSCAEPESLTSPSSLAVKQSLCASAYVNMVAKFLLAHPQIDGRTYLMSGGVIGAGLAPPETAAQRVVRLENELRQAKAARDAESNEKHLRSITRQLLAGQLSISECAK